MYAIVQIGGNQYKVSPGETISVDRRPEKVGDSVNFPALLVADEANVLVGLEAAKINIVSTIVSHSKGKKIDVLRFKAKVRYHRRKGFRAGITTLKIEAIGNQKAKVAQTKVVTPKKTTTKKSSKK